MHTDKLRIAGEGDVILKCSIMETKNSCKKKVLLSSLALDRICLQEDLFVLSDVCLRDRWPLLYS